MLSNTLNNARDFRDLDKLKNNIDFGNKIGKRILEGVCAYLFATTGTITHYEFYDEKVWNEEEFDPKKFNFKQDADINFKNRITPVDVKYLKIIEDFIPLRAFSVIRMSELKGLIIVATKNKFCWLKPSVIVKQHSPLNYDPWGGKKCYLVPSEKIVFKPFLVPIKLTY